MIVCLSCGTKGTHRVCTDCFLTHSETELNERIKVGKKKQDAYDTAFNKAAFAAKALGNAYGYFELCVKELGEATTALKDAATQAYEETVGDRTVADGPTAQSDSERSETERPRSTPKKKPAARGTTRGKSKS